MKTNSEDEERQLCQAVYADHAEFMFEGCEEFPSARKFYASLVAKLIFFVEEAAECDELPFVLKLDVSTRKAYDFTAFAERYFRKVPGFIRVIGMLSPNYRYSEHVDIFVDACRELGILGMKYEWNDMSVSPLLTNPCGRTGGELFNALVKIIRRDWARLHYKERYRRRVREANAICREYQQYVDAWFAKLALLVFLRVDLYYRTDVAHDVTLDGVITDLNHLCTNFRCNQIFRGLRGYIAKIEYGLGKNLHVHMIFIFDTADKKAVKHVFHAQAIGEYWISTVTNGRGDYWNSNAKSAQFEAIDRCGIGPIHATDTARRNNLANYVIRYLCKPDQFIRPKSERSERLLRRGKWPKADAKKLGAPRKKRDANSVSKPIVLTPPVMLMDEEVPF